MSVRLSVLTYRDVRYRSRSTCKKPVTVSPRPARLDRELRGAAQRSKPKALGTAAETKAVICTSNIVRAFWCCRCRGVALLFQGHTFICLGDLVVHWRTLARWVSSCCLRRYHRQAGLLVSTAISMLSLRAGTVSTYGQRPEHPPQFSCRSLSRCLAPQEVYVEETHCKIWAQRKVDNCKGYAGLVA